jgi:hypothetical protein
MAEKRKLFKKVASGKATVGEKEKAAKLQKQASHPDTLLPLILGICGVKAPKHGQAFRARLEDVNEALERLADCEVTLRRNDGSHAWKMAQCYELRRKVVPTLMLNKTSDLSTFFFQQVF